MIQKISGNYIPMLLELDRETITYLPNRSLKYLQVYMAGYSNCLALFSNSQPNEEGRLWNDFQREISEAYPAVGSVYMTLFAAGYDDEESWRLFFRELREFLERCQVEVDFPSAERRPVNRDKYRELIGGVFQQPSMYLGSPSITFFLLFIRGAMTAESRFAFDSDIANEWNKFEQHLALSEPNNWKCSWHRRLLLMSGFNEQKAFADLVSKHSEVTN